MTPSREHLRARRLEVISRSIAVRAGRPGRRDVTAALPVARRRVATLVNLAFQYSSLVLAVLQGIVLVPMYLRHIPLGLYGGWLATGNILMWIDLVDPGLSDIVRQRIAVAYGRKDAPAIAAVLGTGVFLSVLMSLLTLLALPAASAVTRFVRVSGPDALVLTHSFEIGVVGTAFTLASYGVAAAILGLQLSVTAGVVYTVATLAGISTTVVLLLLGVGLPSIPLGMLLRSFVMFAGNGGRLAFWCAKHLSVRPKVSRAEIRAVLGLSVFTFGSRLGSTLIDRMDAVLTTRYLGPSYTVILVLTNRAFESARSAIVAVPTAFMGGISHLVGEGHRAHAADVVDRLVRSSSWFAAVALSSVLALNGVFVGLLVGGRFDGGVSVTAARALSASLTVFSAVLTRVIYSLGGIQQSSGASLLEAGIKLPLQLFLVRRIGLIGMPVAATVGSLLVTGWYFPSVAAKLLGEPRSRQVRQWGMHIVRMLGFGVLAVILRLALSRTVHPWHWATFALAAVLTGASLSLLALALDGILREQVQELVRALALRRRRRGAEV